MVYPNLFHKTGFLTESSCIENKQIIAYFILMSIIIIKLEATKLNQVEEYQA